MPSLGSHSFLDGEGNKYTLKLEFDDAALMEDAVSVDITGTKEAAGSAPIEVVFNVTLEIGKRRRIVISHGDAEIGVIELPPDGVISDIELPEVPLDQAWDRLKELLDRPELLEEIVQALPAGDPVFGCLIKAGISTSVGQVLRCYQDHRDNPDRRAIAFNVLHCLGAHSARMIMTAIWRTGRCAALAGFG